ncbi:NAD(P)H-dependent oxidoreductase subunit E [Chloroflexota bacterium]
MVFTGRTRLTRAQAEGVRYELPEGEQSKVFEERVRSLYHEPAALLEVLHLAQESFGYLAKPVLGWIAQELKIPKSQVYETAAFYSLFSLRPEAKYIIRVCDCLSCYLQGGEAVLKAIRDMAGMPKEETLSDDGLFSLHTVSCLGLCDQAPAMMINQERYGFLTPEKAQHIISDLRNKEHIKEGSHD